MTESDFDHNDASRSAADTRALYGDLRERCPVVHSGRYGGFDVLSRYEDVRQVLTQPASFSSADGVFIPPSGLPSLPALEFDEPAHSAWRNVLDPPLTPRAVRGLEQTITEIVDGLIDDFVDAGSADLVDQLAEPLPAIVVGRMVGLDHEDSLRARELASKLLASIGTDDFDNCIADFTKFSDAQLVERRARPRDDFLTEIASGVVRGMSIDSKGAAGLMTAYLLGGHHSTSSGIAGLLRHVLTEPGLKDRLLAEPKLIANAIEESLRLNTPLQLFARTVREPVEVGGESLSPGRRVMVNLAAANRDPRQFENAEEFELHRSRNRHVAFGAGIHMCQGQHLARAEMRIALRRVLDRLPGLRLVSDPGEKVVGGKMMMTVGLPVTFGTEPS